MAVLMPRSARSGQTGVGTLEIRKTRPDDVPRLAAIERSSAELFRGTHLEFAIEDEPLGVAKHERAVAEGTHWVAAEGSTIAGFCLGHAMAQSFYIDELAVASTHQRQGIGRRLMQTAIDAARGRFPALSLITDRDLPWNMPFYRTLGFEEWVDPEAGVIAELADEEKDGFDMVTRVAMILRFG